MVTGQSVHFPEDALEIALLHGLDLVQGLSPALLVIGQNHLTHGQNPVRLEEHVLGPAQPDAFRAEFPR